MLLLPLWCSLLAGDGHASASGGAPAASATTTACASGPSTCSGIPIGIASQAALIPALYWVLHISSDEVTSRRARLTDRAKHPGEVILLVLMVVVGAPIIEELFFRGLLMRSIQARWNDGLALVVSAVFFALVHFQPILIPGLVVFGLITGTCAQRTGRLGMGILAHAAFNGDRRAHAPDRVTSHVGRSRDGARHGSG